LYKFPILSGLAVNDQNLAQCFTLLVMKRCVDFSTIPIYLFFVQRPASPATRPSLPRQRRCASCRLVNALVG